MPGILQNFFRKVWKKNRDRVEQQGISSQERDHPIDYAGRFAVYTNNNTSAPSSSHSNGPSTNHQINESTRKRPDHVLRVGAGFSENIPESMDFSSTEYENPKRRRLNENAGYGTNGWHTSDSVNGLKKNNQLFDYFQFAASHLPSPVVNMLKRWVKTGEQQEVPPYYNRSSTNGNGPNDVIFVSQSRRQHNGWSPAPFSVGTPPLVDLTSEQNGGDNECVITCDDIADAVVVTSAPIKEEEVLPSTSATASDDGAGDGDNSDIQCLGDRLPGGEIKTQPFSVQRPWQRKRPPFGDESSSSYGRPSIRSTGTTTTTVNRLHFNSDLLSGRLSAARSADRQNSSLREAVNIEERDRYRELLLRLGAGEVTFSQPAAQRTRPSASTTPVSIQFGDTKLDDGHRRALLASRALLEECRPEASSVRRRESEDSVIVPDNNDDRSPSTSTSSVSRHANDGETNVPWRQPCTGRKAPSRQKFDAEKIDRLNQRLALDPTSLTKSIREEYLPSVDRSKQIALEYAKEAELREEARRLRQRETDEDIRLRLKLSGLVLPEPEEEIDEFPELPNEAEDLISRVWSRNGDPNELFASEFSIDIRRKDLLTLKGLEWLNDEIINFYLNLIVHRSKHSKKLPKVYTFNTFFYNKIVQGGHATVKRWTRKVDVFAYDLLLIPVHLSAHWCMAIVDFQRKAIDYYDSMGGKNNKCLSAVSEYLCAESLDKRKETYDMGNWEFECLRGIPRQLNGSDCGVFACKFAEYASRRAKVTFEQENMPYFRRRMVYEICTKQLM